MSPHVATLTAATPEGRAAIEEVALCSYRGDIDAVPARWARVRVVDGVPVAYALVDPNRRMDFPRGHLRFAFLSDIATRTDRRGEGHFRALMDDTFAALHAEGVALLLTHGRCSLYRRFGFEVFTYHSGVFATPELIARRLGLVAPTEALSRVVVDDHRAVQPDLLVVRDVQARDWDEARAALQAAGVLARAQGKARILFEHPAAPSYGSLYPRYASLETPFVTFARACGAQVCVQGADPEGGAVPDADWILVLDAAALLRQTLPLLTSSSIPDGNLCLETGAGTVTLTVTGGRASASAGRSSRAEYAAWPSAALAQLVSGYQPAGALAARHDVALSGRAQAVLEALFPRCWRLSRNESWVFRA